MMLNYWICLNLIFYMRNFYKLLNILTIETVRINKTKFFLIILLFPLGCIWLSYITLMDSKSSEFYLQTSNFKQVIKIVGFFITLFLPLLVSTFMYSLNNIDSLATSINLNSLIPKYIQIFSKILITLILTIVSVIILLSYIYIQIIYINFDNNIFLNVENVYLIEFFTYIFLLPFLLLPYLELIALIQSFSKNIIVSFVLPLIACYVGNFLVIASNSYLIYSPINLTVSILKPIFSTSFLLSIVDFFKIFGVCIVSILIFSYLIFLKGIKYNNYV